MKLAARLSHSWSLTLSQPLSRPEVLLARVALWGAAATTSDVSCLKLCLDPSKDKKTEEDGNDSRAHLDHTRNQDYGIQTQSQLVLRAAQCLKRRQNKLAPNLMTFYLHWFNWGI